MPSYYTADDQDPRLAAQQQQPAPQYAAQPVQQQPTPQYVAPSANYSQGDTGYVAPGSAADAPAASASNTARFRDAGITVDDTPQQPPQQQQPSYGGAPANGIGPANARYQAMTANPGQYGLPKSGFVHSLLDFIVPGGDPRSRNYEAQLSMAQRAAQMETQGMGAQARAKYEAAMADMMPVYRAAQAQELGQRGALYGAQAAHGGYRTAPRPQYGKPFIDAQGIQHQPYSFIDPTTNELVTDEFTSNAPVGVSPDEAAREAGRNARNAATNRTRSEIADKPARSRTATGGPNADIQRETMIQRAAANQAMEPNDPNNPSKGTHVNVARYQALIAPNSPFRQRFGGAQPNAPQQGQPPTIQYQPPGGQSADPNEGKVSKSGAYVWHNGGWVKR